MLAQAKEKDKTDRRNKMRFPLQRELRYKLLEDDRVVESGMGETVDMASSGVAFQIDHALRVGAYVELSISWPVLLDDSCAMRLIVFGRIVRSAGKRSACCVDKYEFRTQARVAPTVMTMRNDSMLQRYAGAMRNSATAAPRKENLKAAGF